VKKAGKLDRRLRIERVTTARDALGGQSESWATLATIWAEYQPVKDGERFRAGEIGRDQLARFRIRWSAIVATVTQRDRLVFEGAVYEIVGVKELGRHMYLEITAALKDL